MNKRGELVNLNLNYFGLLSIYLVIWPFRHVKNKGGLNFEWHEYCLLKLFVLFMYPSGACLGKHL